jgi:ABC-type sugar transport system substrate-binding protein
MYMGYLQVDSLAFQSLAPGTVVVMFGGPGMSSGRLRLRLSRQAVYQFACGVFPHFNYITTRNPVGKITLGFTA